MPTLYMLIGVPGSGKSFFIKNFLLNKFPNIVVVSTDNYIEQLAKQQGKTYNDVFKSSIDSATKNLDQQVKQAVSKNYDIAWDQTNTSKGARRKKLAMIPDSYKKIAVVFPTPEQDELQRRLASRPGKEIPPEVVSNMIKSLQMPSEDEGFDEIKIIGPY